MSMLVAVVLGVLGVVLIWAGASGNFKRLMELLPAEKLRGSGSVGPPLPGEGTTPGTRGRYPDPSRPFPKVGGH